MTPRFNAVVGRKSIRSGVGSFTAADTRSARADMKRVIQNYRKFVDYLEGVTPSILLDSLQPAFDLSQKYVPVKNGTLKRSGYLEITEFRGRPTVEIGYGRGGNPDYAAVVHEQVEWRHKSPTRAKYLQAALQETESNIQARIIDRYRDVFR